MIKTYISALLVILLAAVQMTTAVEGSDQAPSAAESEMLSWLLEKGVGHYGEGNYDEALRMFEGVLAIDNYNAKATNYKKRAANKIAAKEVRNQRATREQAIADVNAAWNAEPKVFGAVVTSEDAAVSTPRQLAIEQMEARLKAITIPSLDFTDANVEDVLLFLAAAGRRFSEQGEDVDIALLGMERVADDSTVSISFADMNLYEGLQFVVEMTSLKFEVGPNVVSVMPANYVPVSQMITKSYDINPEVGMDFESVDSSGSASDDLFGDSFSGEATTGPIELNGFFSVVDFPEGSSAIYQPRFHKLFAKNTPKNLKVLEAVLEDLDEEAVKRRAQQVEIEAKFVEFTEGALAELGFDWTVYGNGSVAGFQGKDGNYFQAASGYSVDSANLPTSVDALYTSPVSGQKLITEPDGRNGQNLFGASQRINSSAFDPLLTGVLATMGGTPAAMMFGNGDVDLRITAMEQEGTADVLSAPRITTKSGNEALIRVAETHRYPQDYIVETGQRTAPIVKPQDWEDYDMGVSLKVTPVVDTESGTIDLELQPQILVYKGVDTYRVALNAFDGGGNNSAGSGGDGSPLNANMPFFERRTAQTQVTVADGHTVVMGGMVDERTETFRDQIPLLGDIPYLGRLFRSEGSRTTKRNLTIFVKATLIDSQGMTSAERELTRQTAAN